MEKIKKLENPYKEKFELSLQKFKFKQQKSEFQKQKTEFEKEKYISRGGLESEFEKYQEIMEKAKKIGLKNDELKLDHFFKPKIKKSEENFRTVDAYNFKKPESDQANDSKSDSVHFGKFQKYLKNEENN